MVSGSNQQNSKMAVATRADRRRKLDELVERVPPPPMKNKADYNGGLGKAALSTEDWLSTLVPSDSLHAARLAATADAMRETPEIKDQLTNIEWDVVANGYDWSCGMQRRSTWAHDFMMLMFEEALALEIETTQPRGLSLSKGIIAARLCHICDMVYFGAGAFLESVGRFDIQIVPSYESAEGLSAETILQRFRYDASKRDERFRQFKKVARIDPTTIEKAVPASPAQVAALQSGDEVILKEEVALTQADAFKVFEQTEPASEKAAINWLVKDGFDEVDAKKHWAAWRKAKGDKADDKPSQFEARTEQRDDLYDAITKACKNPIAANFKLPSGFSIREEPTGLYIIHAGLPRLRRLVGAKLASGKYGAAIQKGEAGRLIVQLLEANKAKQSVVKTVTTDVTSVTGVTSANRDTGKNMVKVGSESVVGL